ncbi:EAL domain-containing protein [Candidatus Methylobacter favarea]|uniref:cyclic-guanylate-specific phosphodiesterase n=1 Tax=Candidatus Methylobacter favarea TaxID=2707345 RepID=A0A8S0XG89_9GAMM|nr:EAL domain-containing protein [Candidatus Methylobacter favarea]CAA9890867.1 EAL domain-containing protein [Candidatus Methylobacter favarea]
MDNHIRRDNSNNNIEILIAEDSRTQAEQLRFLLEERGYKVTAAANGREALESAHTRMPWLIISDIIMPEMNGYELCKAIKSDITLKQIPVILVTTLSDPKDVISGLECGADNFIRKPYDDCYLLSRIDYLLMNLQMRKNQKMQLGVEIDLGGSKHFITAERQQILDLLISTYEQAIHINSKLKQREQELACSNLVLNGLYRIAEGLNQAFSEQDVVEIALERTMQVPGIEYGWIYLREDTAHFRLAATRNLPITLRIPEILDENCICCRQLAADQIKENIKVFTCEKCELSGKADVARDKLSGHVCVPLWNGGRIIGLMNLAGSRDSLYNEEKLKVLDNVGNQVAVALERARLHEHLEQLVKERTRALTLEIEERKRIQEDQARLVAIIEATPDLVVTLTPEGGMLYANQTGQQILGLKKNNDLSRQSLHGGFPEWMGKRVMKEGIPHAIRHGVWSGETTVLSYDGREMPFLQVIIAHKDKDGSLQYLSTIGRDITQLKADKARIVRLNRIYSLLSGINTTIVRVRKAEELFVEACRIAIDLGKFMFAWIGMLDNSTLKIKPIATAGYDDGYLAQLNLSAAAASSDACRFVTEVIAQARPFICNDIATDDRVQAWRSAALKRGYRSAAVLPLILEMRTVGVFVLYAAEANAFDKEEMALLVEMAGDISFSLDHLEKEQLINYLACFDAVTGLPNRALFQDRVDQWIGTANLDQREFSLIMLDLERFSNINESFGRRAGDDLLCQFTRRLTAILDETDILAHLSGDYFCIATLRGDKSLEVAHILEMILSGIQNQPFRICEAELRVSARAGISSYPADGQDMETLLRNAEAALKKAKRSGDKYLFYTPEFNAQVSEKLSLENKLRRALEQEQLVLHYQPKIELINGRIIGLEALLRWNDPEIGLVPPMRFIPLLEETGLIIEAGRWALEKAVADSLVWQAKGFRSPRIAVNVSPIQLRQKDFVNTVASALSGAGKGMVELELEITESLIMQDIEANIQKLRRIREMNVEVSIDDFGTGYSSLSYLSKLPVNTLKIDRAFITHMSTNSDDLSIVSTIISLAHTLNLKVVAEGVETDEQANLLRRLKCDEIQGFLFSPGVPAPQIEKFLLEEKALINK